MIVLFGTVTLKKTASIWGKLAVKMVMGSEIMLVNQNVSASPPRLITLYE